MTHEDLMNLVPGPEADRLAAEAMGNLVVAGDHLFDFSRSYDSAWRIVEFMRSKGWMVRVQEIPDGIPWLHNDKHEVHKKSAVTFHPFYADTRTPNDYITAYGENSCMAIIRALLIWRARHQAE